MKKIFKNIFPSFSQENPVTNSASVPPLPPIFAPFFHFKRFSLQEKYYIKMTNDSKLIFRYFEKKFENLTERTAFFIMCSGTKRISRPSAGSGRKQGKERKSLYGKVPGPSHICWLHHCASLWSSPQRRCCASRRAPPSCRRSPSPFVRVLTHTSSASIPW